MDTTLFGLADAHIDVARYDRTIEVVAAADAGSVAVELISRLSAWADEMGEPFDRRQVPVCCLFAAYVGPWLPLRGAHVVAKTALWILATDRWADDLAHTPDELFATGLARCRGVAEGLPAGHDSPLAAALSEIRDEILSLQRCELLHGWWREATRSLLAGMAFERATAVQVAGGRGAPAIEEYLRHGAASTGLPMLAVAQWAAMRPDAVMSLPALRGPLQDAALVIRLANDLRGHERELREGVVDAITLGMPLDEVGRLLAERLARCRRSLRPLISDSCDGAVGLHRQLLWSLRSYQRADAGHVDACENGHE